jgi:hypothetical protein
MEYHIEDLERPKIKSPKIPDRFHYLHYLLIISSYLYIKSFDTCDESKFNCDYYYDKFTILYKFLLIIASGAINAFILFLAILKFYQRKVLLAETLVLIFSYIFINLILKKEETFEYTGTLFSISFIFSLVLFFALHTIFNISLVLYRLYGSLRKLLIFDVIIKIKICIFTLTSFE